MNKRHYGVSSSFLLGVMLIFACAAPEEPEKKYLSLIRAFPEYAEAMDNKDAFLSHPYDFVRFRNEFYVVDAVQNCIKVFSSEGGYRRTIGRKGSGPGELLDPFVIAGDRKEGTLFCQDGGNSRISVFAADGGFAGSYKTSASVVDMVWMTDRLVVTAYNTESRSLLASYDSSGQVESVFGEFFDEKVNQLSFAKFLYRDMTLKTFGGKLYVFYAMMPYIQIFDHRGELLKTVTMNFAPIKELYLRNIDPGNKTPQSRRINIQSWLRGADVTADRFYCYSPLLKSMLVFDHSGTPIESYSFREEMDDHAGYSLNFIEFSDDAFYFVDIGSAQIKAYALVDSL